MDLELPKRMLRPGFEPLVSQINNSCRMPILSKLEELLPREYKEMKKDPVFSKIIAIHDNGLNYSARMIHSLLCRQLVTDKLHELWFLFAKRPLRFSLQEFYAVTGLRYAANDEHDFTKWEDDGGFWSKHLKQDGKISLMMIWKVHMVNVNQWRRVDRQRLVYVCIIAGVILARGEKAIIPNEYIKVVMSVDKIRAYPWGVRAFDLLLDSVFKTRDNFFLWADTTKSRPRSYVLDGFSYALQVWIMEAIPLIGNMLGEKLDESYGTAVRCANWSGAAKVSYEEIIQLENTFGTQDVLYPFISVTGNSDVIEDMAYQQWSNEMTDCRIDRLKGLLRQDYDWTNHIWEVEDFPETSLIVDEGDDADLHSENTDEQPIGEGSCGSTSKKRKTKLSHHGAEKRKMKLLLEQLAAKQAPAATQGPNLEEMKNFLQQMIHDSFTAMEDKLGKRIDEKIGKLETEVTELKESLILCEVANKIGGTSSSPKPPAVDSTRVQPGRVVEKIELDNLYEVQLTQNSESDLKLETQEYLSKALNGLSQDSFISGFDQTQESVDWWTSMTSLRPGIVENPSMAKDNLKELRLSDTLSDVDDNPDSLLTFVPQDEWYKFCEWAASPVPLHIGPSMFNMTLAKRIIGPKEWLCNEDIDAVMWLFRENTTLHRWDQDRVAFMPCLFNVQVNTAYNKYLVDKKRFVLDSFLIAYGNGELPSHGRTNQVWGVDVDRIYVPLFVNQNHWISMCVNILERRIEVFDCDSKRNRQHVDKYAFLIPRIVKAVQPPSTKKHLTVTAYSIVDIPMKRRLNKSCCDCGVYALKFIESHLRGIEMSLVDDEMIRMCRAKIAFDLWKAANDPILVDRMSRYAPPVFQPADIVDLE